MHTIPRFFLILLALLQLSCEQEDPPQGAEAPTVPSHFPIRGTQTGTQAFAANYTFDSTKTALVEQAEVARAASFDIFKFGLGTRSFKEHEIDFPWQESWYDLPNRDSYSELSELVVNEPSVRHVLEMDFKVICLWAYSLRGEEFSLNGAPSYNEIYKLTKTLLQRYNNSGKLFLLGHWEGDWALLPGYNASLSEIPSDKKKEYLAWVKNRQAAIEAARRDVAHNNVWVAHYVEVNRVSDYVDLGHERIVNGVLPEVTIDAVSYSVYDAGLSDLPRNLDTIAGKARFTPYLDGVMEKKVFIGEFGFPIRNKAGTIIRTPEQQNNQSMAILEQGESWGVPLAFYWQLYNNETCDNGAEAGFWLIDEHNQKQPIYHELLRYAK